MPSNGRLSYQARSPAKEAGVYAVIIDPGSGTPVISQDDADIIASVASGGTGLTVVTMRDRWANLQVFPTVISQPNNERCDVTAITKGGSTASAFTLRNELISDGTDTASAELIHCLIYVQRTVRG